MKGRVSPLLDERRGIQSRNPVKSKKEGLWKRADSLYPMTETKEQEDYTTQTRRKLSKMLVRFQISNVEDQNASAIAKKIDAAGENQRGGGDGFLLQVRV